MDIKYIKKHLKPLVESTIKEADDIMQGIMILPGSEKPCFVGNPPKWNENPFNHNEYTFHLNRMNHWLPLLHAYALTDDDRYAEKVISELEDWLCKCPRPKLDNIDNFNELSPWRSLEAGIRMHKTWFYLPRFLEGTPYFTDDIKKRFYISVSEHAEVLAQICPKLWPNADHNHYLMENLGLLAASIMLDNIAYKNQAVRELERCAQNQITKEGGQIEGCPSYHNGSIFWFTSALMLCNDFSDEYRLRVRNMLEYSMYTFRPNGTTVPWGDSTAKKGAVRSAIYGYTAFHTADYLKLLQKFVDEDVIKESIINMAWEIEDISELFNELNKKSDFTLPTYRYFATLNQAAMRTNWSKDALSVFFACRVPIKNAHAHIDPMGFDFTAYGKPMIVDPGKYTYKECELRYRFKSSAWHNTATINGKDHFKYISSWKYAPQKNGGITEFDDFKLRATHHCFSPCIHTRTLTLESDRLIVEDVFDNLLEDDSIQIYFHFDYPEVHLYSQKAFTNAKGANVVLTFDSRLKAEILDGLVSDINDNARQSKRLRLTSVKGGTCRQFITVITPQK